MKHILCVLLSLLLLAGCGAAPQPEAPAGETVTITDDLGRTVTVAESPDRAACLIGSFASLWHLAGGTESIVAAAHDTWTYFDLPLQEDVVDLGGTKELSLETLLACDPDLILASVNTSAQMALEPTFTQLGIPTAYFDVTTFEDYLRVLDLCTTLTGDVGAYTENGLNVKAQVDQAIARADGTRPTVLYLRASGTSVKAKGSEGSVLGEMLADLDTVNIADRSDSLLDDLSLEVILREDPDYIFLVYQSADPAAAQSVMETTLLSNPAWSSLTAVQEGRCHVMDPTLYNLKPNEKWGTAYASLADLLYPTE